MTFDLPTWADWPHPDSIVNKAKMDMVNNALASAGADLDSRGVSLRSQYGDLAVAGNWVPALQEAYDSNRPVYIDSGTFDLEGELVPRDWAPRFFGAGRHRTILRQQGSEALFSQYKDSSGVALPNRESLARAVTGDAGADIQPGTSILEFNTAGYAVGDQIHLRSQKLWPVIDEGAVYGEIVRIRSIDSASQATLCGPVDEQYLLADSPTVAKLDMLRGAHFADLTFENPDPGTKDPFAYGIYLNYCLRPVVAHVDFIGLDAPAFSVKNSVDWRAIDLGFYDLTDDAANGRYGYGINPGAGSRDGKVFGGNADGCRHGFTLGATLGESPVRGTLVVGFTVRHANSYAVDTHGPGRDTTFLGVEARNCRDRAFNNRALDTTIEDCKSVNCGSGIVSDVAESVGLIVKNFEIRRAHQVAGSGGNGINILPPGVEIDGLKVYDTEGIGVVFNAGADGYKLHNVRCYRTETTGAAGAKRAVAISANNGTVDGVYGEDVDKVVRYSNATGTDERGVWGRSITLLREIAGTCTFSRFEHQTLNGETETQSATGSISLVPGTAAKTVRLTGVITADRGVTLSKTNAVTGMKRRIVRTAAATGAFKRNIDNGTAGTTIKQLDPSQYVDVEYNGTDWVVDASGSV